MDTVSAQRRSEIMRRIRGKNTLPELIVRRVVHRLGYRYRLHKSELPGSPDLVFGPKRKVIFVNGCFWHGHNCRSGRLPKTRPEYWADRFAKNRERDSRKLRELNDAGWCALTLWECELRDEVSLTARLQAFLG